MDRKEKTISQNCEKMINNQIIHEFENYFIYLNFANELSRQGFLDGESYFKFRAEEELKHAHMLIDYLTKNDGVLNINEIKNPIAEPEKGHTLKEIFQLTLDREILTTKKLIEIWNEAANNNMIGLRNWLENGLIKIQEDDEEPESRLALTIMKEESSDNFVKLQKIKQSLNN